MRTKKIWIVVWTPENATRAGNIDPLDQIDRFSNRSYAECFSIGKKHYGEPAKAVMEDVPVHIARRWGF